MRLVRGIALAAAVVVVLVLGVVSWISISGIPNYPVPKLDLHVQPTPERVARGKLLAGMLCSECHKNPGTQALTGRPLLDLPPQFGTAFSQNITRDADDGLGGWSDEQIAVLVRTGIHRTGRYVMPWMTKLPHISDEDLASIISFLRSDDPLVAPHKGRQPAGNPSLLAKFLTHVAFKPLPLPTAPIATPPESDQVAFGKYLAEDALLCFACHSADFASNNDLVPSQSKGFFGGGIAMPDINQRILLTANLTPDPETGLGRWSQADFRRALQKGFRPDQRPLRYPMPRYVEMSDAWADALYAYLRTVPPLRHAVPRDDDPHLATGASAGEVAYARYSCHGLSGEGMCDLRGAHQKYKTDAELISWIRDASKLKPDTNMPTWDGLIAEGDYAPLADYVRLLGKRWESAGAEASR